MGERCWDLASRSLPVRLSQSRLALCFIVDSTIAQAIYSLSQDNPEFQRKVLHSDVAVQTLARMVSADTEQNNGRKKGKGKATAGEKEEDGRALLLRVLIAGGCISNMPEGHD